MKKSLRTTNCCCNLVPAEAGIRTNYEAYWPNNYEDTYLDVIQKAMRGLSIGTATLARLTGLKSQEILSLLDGTLQRAHLLRVASALKLDPSALLHLADEISPQAIALPEQMLCFTTPYHDMLVHSYLLWSGKKAVAFDTGTDCSLLFDALSKHQLKLDALFLTHGHLDHIATLDEIITKTGATAWIREEDLVQGTKPLPLHFSYQLDTTICLETRATPGHSPGGTTYVIEGLSVPVAIVGDAIFAYSIGGISAAAYHTGLSAIQKNILSLPITTILAPGHGPMTTVKEELQWNPFFASSLT